MLYLFTKFHSKDYLIYNKYYCMMKAYKSLKKLWYNEQQNMSLVVRCKMILGVLFAAQYI